jgi:hypothetical protein
MDKGKKKQMLHLWREQERKTARSRLPLSPSELRALFDMLNLELPCQGCDHSRRITLSWLEGRGHDVERVFAWLDETGGFCDCEVLANSEQDFEEAMRGFSDA